MANVMPRFGQNWVLATLSGDQYARLSRKMEVVRLTFGDVIYDAGKTIDYVYFPTVGIISLLVTVESGQSAQVAMVGAEGFVGGSISLGFVHSPFKAIVQGSGTALRVTAPYFRKTFGANPKLQSTVHNFIQVLVFEIAQNAACNQFHSVRQRLARLLLTTGDFMHSNKVHLTQEYLGHALGVPRGAVTAAANSLKSARLITYVRGEITLLNRPGLQAEACACYKAVSRFLSEAVNGNKSDRQARYV